jgi:hypothetical protein
MSDMGCLPPPPRIFCRSKFINAKSNAIPVIDSFVFWPIFILLVFIFMFTITIYFGYKHDKNKLQNAINNGEHCERQYVTALIGHPPFPYRLPGELKCYKKEDNK